jgi:hypothetical protein
MSFFEGIPNEIITMIFTRLNAVSWCNFASTCRKMYETAWSDRRGRPRLDCQPISSFAHFDSNGNMQERTEEKQKCLIEVSVTFEYFGFNTDDVKRCSSDKLYLISRLGNKHLSYQNQQFVNLDGTSMSCKIYYSKHNGRSIKVSSDLSFQINKEEALYVVYLNYKLFKIEVRYEDPNWEFNVSKCKWVKKV